MTAPGVPFDQIGERYTKSFSERSAQLAAGGWLVDELPPAARVVDLGCGTGEPTAKQLSAAGLDVVGVDESEVMLELARRNAPDARFVAGDLADLDPELGDFDAAAAFFSLLMLPKARIGTTLAAVRDRLTGPGLLVVSMVAGDLDDVPLDFLGTPVRVSAYPADQLRQVVTDAGFDVRDLSTNDAEVAPGHTETHLYLRAIRRVDGM